MLWWRKRRTEHAVDGRVINFFPVGDGANKKKTKSLQISDQARGPAEFKHIIKRRKRN